MVTSVLILKVHESEVQRSPKSKLNADIKITWNEASCSDSESF